jgi:hypothetical protein
LRHAIGAFWFGKIVGVERLPVYSRNDLIYRFPVIVETRVTCGIDGAEKSEAELRLSSIFFSRAHHAFNDLQLVSNLLDPPSH